MAPLKDVQGLQEGTLSVMDWMQCEHAACVAAEWAALLQCLQTQQQQRVNP